MSIEKDVRNFLNGISENNKVYFDGETDKNPLEYKSGEEITFRLCVRTDDVIVPVPYIQAAISADDGKNEKKIIKASDDGYFYVKTSIDRDGFTKVVCVALDENRLVIDGIDKFEGGAGADVEKIKLCTTVPDDYFDFWTDLVEKARSIPVKVLYEKVLDSKEGYIAKDMRFETTEGRFLSLIVTYPENAAPCSLKMHMHFMGYGVGKAPLIYTPDCLVIGVNSHPLENDFTPEQYAKIREEQYQGYGFDAKENEKPQTSYWYKMLLRDMQAFFIFKDHELLNKKDYVFIGGSQGGMQASHLAAHCGYATECRMDAPWCVDLWAPEKEKRMKGWRPDTSVALSYFDTGVAASYLKCPVYIEAGLGDFICPSSGEMAMYNAIKSPKMIRFMQNRTHSYRPPIKRYYTLRDGFERENYKF